jgi:hypothetical protein
MFFYVLKIKKFLAAVKQKQNTQSRAKERMISENLKRPSAPTMPTVFSQRFQKLQNTIPNQRQKALPSAMMEISDLELTSACPRGPPYSTSPFGKTPKSR